MILNKDDLALIEKEIDGTLSEEMRVIFISRLNDSAFRQEWELQKDIVAAFSRINLRNQLRTSLDSRTDLNTSHSLTHFKWETKYTVAVAASLLIAVMITFFTLRKASIDELFLSYYTPYNVPVSSRNADVATQQKSLQLYAQGEYAAALTHLRSQNKTDGIINTSLQTLIIGNCQLNLDSLDQAYSSFQKVINSNEKILHDDGKWYLALTLLKQNKLTECKAVLEELAISNSLYQRKASALLEQL